MTRKRVGKLRKHKTGVYFMSYKGKPIYFTKNLNESKRRYRANRDAIEDDAPLPWTSSSKRVEAAPEPDGQLALRDGLTMALDDRKRRTGKREHAVTKSNEELILCCGGGSRLISEIGPPDFARFRRSLDMRYAKSTIANLIANTKSQFKWLYDNDHIEHLPRYGTAFKRPTEADIRIERHEKARTYGDRFYSPKEIRGLLEACQNQLQRCIVLLGINCGFGPKDCEKLEFDDLDLAGGWYDSLRAKKGAIPRTAKLWDITIKSIDDYVESDERPPSTSSKIFAGLSGRQIERRFEKLPYVAGCKREGVAAYGLRHSFEEFASAAADQQAVDRVMGHAEAGSAKHYRHGFDKARLERVSDVVYAAVFGA